MPTVALASCCSKLCSRELVTWLSEKDAVELFKAAIEAPAEVHFEIIYGLSNNSQKKLSNEGASFSFNPQDNAELYLAEISQEAGSVAKHFHGGPFTERFFAGDLQKTLNHTLGPLKKNLV